MNFTDFKRPGTEFSFYGDDAHRRSFPEGGAGGLAPKPLNTDNIFFKTESAYGTNYIS